MDTGVDSFERCRREIRDFLVPFVDWMLLDANGWTPGSVSTLSGHLATLTDGQRQLITDRQLIAAPSSSSACPDLSFVRPSFIVSQPNVCTNTPI